MHRALQWLALLCMGAQAWAQCAMDPAIAYHMPVYAVMSNTLQGNVHVNVHNSLLNLTFIPSPGFTFYHFRSIAVASLDNLPVNHVTGVANLQMYPHHVILDSPNVMFEPEVDVCCDAALLPVLSVYVSGKSVDMPTKWQTGVLDGVPINGHNRLGGTYVPLRGLCDV